MITRFTRPPCQWCNFSVEMWNCVVTPQCKKHPIVRTSVYLCQHRAPYQGLLNLGHVTYCSPIVLAKGTLAIYWNITKHVSCHCEITRVFCLYSNEPEKPREIIIWHHYHNTWLWIANFISFLCCETTSTFEKSKDNW
jgi:hypothetical protein